MRASGAHAPFQFGDAELHDAVVGGVPSATIRLVFGAAVSNSRNARWPTPLANAVRPVRLSRVPSRKGIGPVAAALSHEKWNTRRAGTNLSAIR